MGFLPLSAAFTSLGAGVVKGESGFPESGLEETEGAGGGGGKNIKGGW